MKNCVQVTRLYSESQERPLSTRERLAVQFHVLMCSGCRNFGLHMTVLRSAAHTYAKGSPSMDDDVPG